MIKNYFNTKNKLLSIKLYLFFLLFGLFTVSAQKQMKKTPVKPTVCYAGTKSVASTTRSLKMEQMRSKFRTTPPTADISVNFTGDFLSNDAAREAFQFAVDVWSREFITTVPIIINADFTDLGPGALAAAGPGFLIENFPNAPLQDVGYPIALANQLARVNLDPVPDRLDVFVLMGSNVNWDFSTSGNIDPNSFDFVGTVIHEIAHGLGFFSTGFVGTSGIGDLNLDGNPSIFDVALITGDGDRIVELPNESAELGRTFISNNLFATGPFAEIASQISDDGLPRIFAPTTFSPGSSLSHLDEQEYPEGDPNALMTPNGAPGESLLDIGPLARAIFADMGWQLSQNRAFVDLLETEININPLPRNTENTVSATIIRTDFSGDPINVTLTSADSNTLVTGFSTNNFMLGVGERQEIEVELSSVGVSVGNFTERVFVSSEEFPDDVVELTLNIRVSNVSGPRVVSSQSSFSGTFNQEQIVSGRFDLENTGLETLNYQIDVIGRDVDVLSEGLSFSINSGQIAPVSSENFEISFSTMGVLPGTYEGAVVINSNDERNPSLELPISFTVNSIPFVAVRNSELIEELTYIQDPNETSVTRTVTVENISDLNVVGRVEIGLVERVGDPAVPVPPRDSIAYDSGNRDDIRLLNIGAAAVITSAVRFDVEDDEFLLTAVSNFYFTAGVVLPVTTIQILRGGNTPDDAELLMTIRDSQIVEDFFGDTVTTRLPEFIKFTKGEHFWVTYRFPEALDFPQGGDSSIDETNIRPNTYAAAASLPGNLFNRLPFEFVNDAYVIRAISDIEFSGVPRVRTDVISDFYEAPADGSMDIPFVFDFDIAIPGVYEVPILFNTLTGNQIELVSTITVLEEQPNSNFLLVNATTNEVIGTLEEGATIDAREFPRGTEFNIIAEFGGSVESVRFQLNDNEDFRIENSTPYTLAGDFESNFFEAPLQEGLNTVVATAFRRDDARGRQLDQTSVNFNFIPRPVNFFLINATTNEVIGALENGETVDASDFPRGTEFSVSVEFQGRIGSVNFELNGNEDFRTENAAPFTVAGDFESDFFAAPLQEGLNNIVATAFARDDARGRQLGRRDIAFNFIPRPVNFFLINATTNEVIGALENGTTVDASDFPRGTEFNVSVEFQGRIGSVRFGLNGNEDFRTENAAPFTVAGDFESDFFAAPLQEGSNTVTATAFARDDSAGRQLGERNVTFNFVPRSPITYFLANARNNTIIRELVDGDVIRTRAGVRPTIIAEIDGIPRIGAVAFNFNGNNNFRVDRGAPYTLGGDNDNNNFSPVSNFIQGTNTLTASVRSRGNVLATRSISFGFESNRVLSTLDEALSVYPNPTNDVIMLIENFEDGTEPLNMSGNMTDVYGRVIFSNLQHIANSKDPLANLTGLPAGIYFLNLTDENGNKIQKRIIKK